MDSIHTTVSQGGRIVIPAAYREKFNISEGDEVTLSCDEFGLHITTPSLAWQNLQNLVTSRIPSDVQLVEELIAARRKEARSE